MKLDFVMSWINSLGLDEQPTPWDEHLHIFWDVGWKDALYGLDCERWSFVEKDGEVEKIDVTIYDSKWGGQRTTFYELKTLGELYESTGIDPDKKE